MVTEWTIEGDLIETVPVEIPGKGTVYVPDNDVDQDLVVRDSDVLRKVGTNDAQKLSVLPRDRMAAGSEDFNHIVEMIRQAEEGRSTPDQIEVHPGGSLVAVDKNATSRGLSVLPQDRMATVDHPSAREIRQLDPNNVEKWEWVDDPVIPGWKFEMAPAHRRFSFFTFRASTYSGHWLVSPITPNLDELVGHETHVIKTNIGGGAMVPIVCRRHGRMDHSNIEEVRATTAKFALYHSLRGATGMAPFSA